MKLFIYLGKGKKIVNQIIELTDAFKKFVIDQDKIIPPEETVRRFKDKLKKIDLDILKEVVRIDNKRLDIPVYFSVYGKDANDVIGNKKQMGKGGTPEQAKASAVMELAERFSLFSFYKNPENFTVQKYSQVSEKAIPFEMIAQSVNDESEDLHLAREIFEDLPLKWTLGYNLTREEEVLIPFDWFFTINEFNGSSAGNCIEEALIQGICEIVERHTSAMVSQKKLKIPGINPDSTTDPMVVEMIKKYKKAGVNFYLSDFTLDMGIPTIGMLAYDPITFPEKSEIVWTAGTTPDPQKALSRALTEVAQLAGDFNSGSNYVASGLPKFTNIEDAEFITNPESVIDITNLPNIAHVNIKTEIENCVSSLAKRDLEVLVINLKHGKLEIPAFYTMIPGTHFRERSQKSSVGMFVSKLIFENNEVEKSVVKLRQIDKILQKKYYIKFYLGSCYLDMNNPEKGLEYFNEALDLDPNLEDIPSIYSYMGTCFKEMNHYRRALEVLQKGEALDKERTDIYNLMGFCHFMLKEHEEAIENFQHVKRLDPSSAINYANIGSNYRDMNNKKKAIEYYRLALALDPSIDFAIESLKRLESENKTR